MNYTKEFVNVSKEIVSIVAKLEKMNKDDLEKMVDIAPTSITGELIESIRIRHQG